MKKVNLILALIIIIFVVLLVLVYTKTINLVKEDKITNQVENNIVKEPTKEEIALKQAKEMLGTLTIDEKIGQLLLVRYPDDNNAVQIARDNCLGGYVLFEKDFSNKTLEQVQSMVSNVQSACKIPLIMSVDEEGGTVVRISNNANLAPSKFKSPMQLYNEGGLDLIRQDTINKSQILSNLGINLNLAPVVDISENPSDYMYNRTIGQGVEVTCEYAKTVIEASKGIGVNYTLKHFPGYGHNKDTHKTSSLDTRSYDEIVNVAIPPFKAGIEAGAKAVLISHNIVECIDNENPASISKNIHDLLRNNLNFKGIVITDDLDMSAVSGIADVYVKAVLAGNNFLITSDYQASINNIKNAITNGIIGEEQIDGIVVENLAWKFNNLL